MRIALAAFGSRGDFQPMAALAVALAARGHDVRLIGFAEYAPFVAGRGVDFRAVSGDHQAIFLGDAGRRMFASGRRPVALIRAVTEITRTWLPRWAPELRDHVAGVDLLIGEFTSFALMASLAELWELPSLRVLLQPVHRSALLPSPMLGGLKAGLPRRLNRLSHDIADQILWQPSRRLMNRIRTEIYGLPPWPLLGPVGVFRRARMPTLMAYSAAVVPRPADWGREVQVTGFWFLDRPIDWQPPDDLVRFLDAGAAPVYLGFGSMGLTDPAATAALLVAAIRSVGCRAVIAAGWGGLAAADLPPNIHAIDAIPHDWLFPRMAAIVHHGGAGTTAAALRAGVPSVVVPFMADQPYWAGRLQGLGVAPPPIAHLRLTAPALAAALRVALGDPAMRARAKALGDRIGAEDGLGAAVARIEALA